MTLPAPTLFADLAPTPLYQEAVLQMGCGFLLVLVAVWVIVVLVRRR